jgi:hypothetical protein
MILGMTTFTAVHALLSLIGILSGLVVLFGQLTAKPMNTRTLLFLATTLATSATGFFFPHPRLYTSTGSGHPVDVHPRRDDRRTLWLPSCRCLALGLRRRRCRGAVFQLVRTGGAVVPEDPGAAHAGTDRIGAGLCSHTRNRAGVRSRHTFFGGQSVPARIEPSLMPTARPRSSDDSRGVFRAIIDKLPCDELKTSQAAFVRLVAVSRRSHDAARLAVRAHAL